MSKEVEQAVASAAKATLRQGHETAAVVCEAARALDEDGKRAYVVSMLAPTPMLNFKAFQSAKCVLAGVELMHMIRKDKFMMQGCSEMSFADQFYALAEQIRAA